jgi:hypothetical protein
MPFLIVPIFRSIRVKQKKLINKAQKYAVISECVSFWFFLRLFASNCLYTWAWYGFGKDKWGKWGNRGNGEMGEMGK